MVYMGLLHLRHLVEYPDLPANPFSEGEPQDVVPFGAFLRLGQKQLRTGLCCDLDILEIAYARNRVEEPPEFIFRPVANVAVSKYYN